MDTRLVATLIALAVSAGACLGGDSGDSDSTPTPGVDDTIADDEPEAGDGVDQCGQGQAFPDDPDFREAICRPMMAMTEYIGTDVEIDPTWGSRVTDAMLNYDNRDEAMEQLADVLAEIETAGG